MVFIASVLISRNLLEDPADPAAGLRTFGTVLAATGSWYNYYWNNCYRTLWVSVYSRCERFQFI